MHKHPYQNSLYDKPGEFIFMVCIHVILIHMKLKGEQLGTAEATDAFFAMTKLFQSRDIILRRMVYLGIKVEFLK